MKFSKSLVLIAILALPAWAQAATFTVDDPGDTGAGTLRQAITDANNAANSGGPDVIEFNIPGTGIHTITVLSELPAATDPVIIDGYTQPGSSPNTQGPDQGSNAVILIELDGSQVDSIDGITIQGGDSTVRGLAINRFGGGGIFGSGISLESPGNTVEGCFLGTDPTGTQARPNLTRGVFVTSGSNANTIGGTTPAARNLISGNGERGVMLIGTSDDVIQGNLIGTDITGTQALGNGSEGVNIQNTFGALVGGTSAAERNVISGNAAEGINLFSNTGTATSDNLIQGNYIGTDVTGSQDLGNGSDGVVFGGNIIADNLVGGIGSGEGNLIAFNGGNGVFVAQGPGMGILGNSIHSNDGLGIELAAGANNDQPAPVLTAASLDGGLSVQGTLSAAPDTLYTVEFFANAACDPSGAGEGETFLGRISVTTDGAGQAALDFGLAQSFQFSFSAANYSVDESAGLAIITVTRTLPLVADGAILTATATDPNNNTSEFSNCQATSGSSAASVDFATSDGSAVAGEDYEPASGTLNFAAGETSQDFEVVILGDSVAEADETVNLSLSNPSTGATLVDPDTAILTIVDTGLQSSLSGGGCSLQNLKGSSAPSSLAWAGLALIAAMASGLGRKIRG